MTVATVLCQALHPRPGAARQVADAIRSQLHGDVDVTPCIGAFDTIVTIRARNPEEAAAAAARIREVDAVADTLTIIHLEETTDA